MPVFYSPLGSRIFSIRLVPKSVTLNNLNGVIAPILRYLTEFNNFGGRLCQSG